VPLLNPARIVRWNADKHYLGDLAAQGLTVVPTRTLPRGTRVPLAQIMAEEGWDRAVVKPAIGASGVDTFLADATRLNEGERPLAARSPNHDYLVQPFLPQFSREGEWSLVFLDNEYSHAVVKRPAAGEFRVHEEYGGSVTAAKPDAGLVRQARRFVDAVEPLAYARVDGVVVDGVLTLVELELIEPELFFRADPRAFERFVAGVRTRLRS